MTELSLDTDFRHRKLYNKITDVAMLATSTTHIVKESAVTVKMMQAVCRSDFRYFFVLGSSLQTQMLIAIKDSQKFYSF